VLISERFATVLTSDDLQDATVLTSELVTNAVRHGSGRILFRADLDENCLRVEVIDQGGGFEHAIRERDFQDVEGWGLMLVDAIASRWGVHEGTTHVWFDLERAGRG
jgi:anti-sigma regulatory factor (Ser/Thr protein kinase)